MMRPTDYGVFLATGAGLIAFGAWLAATASALAAHVLAGLFLGAGMVLFLLPKWWEHSEQERRLDDVERRTDRAENEVSHRKDRAEEHEERAEDKERDRPSTLPMGKPKIMREDDKA